jgi:TolA-binding protein
MEMTLQLYGQDLISPRKVLEVAEMEDQIEETEMRLREKEVKSEQMQQFQMETFQQEAQRNNLISDRRFSLLDTLEGELGKLELSSAKKSKPPTTTQEPQEQAGRTRFENTITGKKIRY